MARKIKRDIPGPDRRVSVAEAREKGWEALFAPDLAPPLRLVVEIGFGRGEFLRHLAALDPDAAHVGVEVSWKRVLKMARRLARSDERTIRLVEATGEEVVREALAPASVEAFWINFPDPWPKKRHHRRRLIQPPFVAALADRLTPGGALHVATDHVGYAEQIDEVLRAEPALENALAPAPFVREVPGRLRTAYEEMWRAEGRPLHFWSWRRRTA
ncbi:MAG: tRNA (guanosine(46)-N7)-methyltransferase TrmB [Myxococcota bacterium]|nr:tRNA (guanosine(46)-N7)-methyltransferase TrmB [Myxococcota bacterium]